MKAILFILLVYTNNGDVFVAGSGDDCPSAWQGAVIPDNWQTIECVPYHGGN